MVFRKVGLSAFAVAGVTALLSGVATGSAVGDRTPPIPNAPQQGLGFVYFNVDQETGFVGYEDASNVPTFSRVNAGSLKAFVADVPPEKEVLPKDLAIGGVGEEAAGAVTINTEGGSITIGSTANTDPFIAVSIAFTDIGTPSLFLATFTIPTVLMVGPQIATMTATIGITDATGDGASIALDPSFANLILGDVGSVGDPGGTTVCAAGVDVGTAFGVPAGSPPGSAVLPFSAGPTIYGPSAGCDSRMFLTIAFEGSGGGDVYGITARFGIDPAPVPAPSVLALFGAGLIGLAAMRRRSA